MRQCPRCGATLRPARHPAMTVDMCAECGGAYFDHGELARLARKQAESLDQLEALVQPEAEFSAAPREDAADCPGCGTRMDTFQYAFCSGITLDRCSSCSGIWADEGELAAIGDHVEKGDRMACQDTERTSRFFAAEARGVSVVALAGMLTRNPRDEDWL